MSTESNKSVAKTSADQPVNEAVSGSVAVVATVPRSKTELRAEAARARGELAQTLDAIEYKFNVPRQFRVRSRALHARLHDLGEDNPLALAGIVLAAASAAFGAVWLGLKAVKRG